jgi:hypothetical protein
MDEVSKLILKKVGLEFNNENNLNEQTISREQLLCDNKYEEIKILIPDLRKVLSSSFMTGLQNNAEGLQKWPLLNLTRQILSAYRYQMVPVRKSDGYTKDGVKKYKRFFQIEKIKLLPPP